MDIFFSPEAEQDLIEIFDFIMEDNPAAVQSTLDKIQHAISNLAEHPHLGRSGRVPKTRELIIADLPFIIPYQVRRNRLEVLRIYHTARKWPDDFE